MTGLVLSGGGARGFAHLGVLHALDEMGLHIDIISGTSAGAICGAFYCAGIKPKITLEIIQSYKMSNWVRILWRKPGFLHMEKVRELFAYHLPDTFEELGKPLVVSATDILKGELRYFSSGSLSDAVCASSAIPVLFAPVHINGSLYVDGGILNNFPVDPIEEEVDRIIGVHVNPIEKDITAIGMRDIMDRSMHLALSHEVGHKKDSCDIFIEPRECAYVGMFDISAGDRLFRAGYEATMAQSKKIEALFAE